MAAAYEAGVLREVLGELECAWTIDDFTDGSGSDAATDYIRDGLVAGGWLTDDGKVKEVDHGR